MQQFFKSAAGQTRAGIVAAELLAQMLIAANNSNPAFDLSLRGEALPSLTDDLESTGRRGALF